ncbi:MAG: TPM domain-containing protein [Bradyrhizobium sp.]|nr:TPM domain-containing protein [Bradyrhizobium sp.]
MSITRIGRHLLQHHWQLKRIFTPDVLARIEQAIQDGERSHAGQLRFVVEGALDGRPLWRNQPPRERALDLFSHLRIWDTAHNNGVLIYLLLADRDVEIIADRGIHPPCAGDQRGLEGSGHQPSIDETASRSIQATDRPHEKQWKTIDDLDRQRWGSRRRARDRCRLQNRLRT